MMRHGYHMGLGFYGSYILIFLLLIISVLIFLVLKSKPSLNSFIIRLLDILKEEYASGALTADEFIERKSIIEDIKYSNSYTPILIERYAKCEITTKEFFNIKNEIESNNYNASICEGLAKGTLSYDKFKLKILGGQMNEKQ
ncbi:SHOCT domain-containing protein [Clostridium autoethanogenum]|uniref:SHOCT domain-containing protein n=1 Tax=Clostridium autoethanogenum TaxID=84023 RepID=A0A3M0SLV1_9CLOT|nr:SHOCT domain-containing protein [Clostridium autoethanogenum]RMC98710.1 SHOCT domain-containing protein [Clostridium autoethanogenum]